MKKSAYMDRAMKAQDPRFARVLGKLGYQRSDMVAQAAAEEEEDELSELRAAYQGAVGKRAYHGWDAEELRAKIAAASEQKDADDE